MEERRNLGPQGNNNLGNTASYNGANTISADQTIDNATYTSNTGGQNALLVNGGTTILNTPEVTKTGDDSSGDNADFYGTNAAILVYNDANLEVVGGSITTNGGHANAVFAYGTGTANISGATIQTSSNNSGGVMVAGGGTLNANDLNVTTVGNSSAAIRSDRGGGTIHIADGTYKTTGVGSPAIYSTADILVDGAELVSTASEGVVVEGLNSVLLNNTRLTATNNQKNGHSETLKTIFLYQSMSGDAEEGNSSFLAESSIITTNSGDHFFVTNTTAVIDLKGNQFIQNDANGAFLRAQAGYWGTAGQNGGQVIISTHDQEINGNFIVDNVSSVSLTMEHSYMKGAFLGNGTIDVSLSADSVIVLTQDSSISTLSNDAEDNTNIYANGHKLYVDGIEVETNKEVAPESFIPSDIAESAIAAANTTEQPTRNNNTSSNSFPVWGYFAIVLGVLVVVAAVLALIFKKRAAARKAANSQQQSQ